jgi:hypothetical protein
MKQWIFTFRVEPPAGVVSGRFGNSVMFVAYQRLTDQWHWIYPGGAEKIEEPQMLFLDETWVREHPSKKNRGRRENPLAIHKSKAEQLQLCF